VNAAPDIQVRLVGQASQRLPRCAWRPLLLTAEVGQRVSQMPKGEAQDVAGRQGGKVQEQFLQQIQFGRALYCRSMALE
jgi:hypothetical protein